MAGPLDRLVSLGAQGAIEQCLQRRGAVSQRHMSPAHHAHRTIDKGRCNALHLGDAAYLPGIEHVAALRCQQLDALKKGRGFHFDHDIKPAHEGRIHVPDGIGDPERGYLAAFQ